MWVENGKNLVAYRKLIYRGQPSHPEQNEDSLSRERREARGLEAHELVAYCHKDPSVTAKIDGYKEKNRDVYVASKTAMKDFLSKAAPSAMDPVAH